MAKRSRVTFRANRGDEKRLKRAAERLGLSLSEFVRDSALRRAEQVLEDETRDDLIRFVAERSPHFEENDLRNLTDPQLRELAGGYDDESSTKKNAGPRPVVLRDSDEGE